jgi:hypothetical protein
MSTKTSPVVQLELDLDLHFLPAWAQRSSTNKRPSSKAEGKNASAVGTAERQTNVDARRAEIRIGHAPW